MNGVQQLDRAGGLRVHLRFDHDYGLGAWVKETSLARRSRHGATSSTGRIKARRFGRQGRRRVCDRLPADARHTRCKC